jgi:hypothetical protein
VGDLYDLGDPGDPGDLGVGAAKVLSRPAVGQVVAGFRRAAYVRFPQGIVALSSLQVPSGPLHLRSRLPIDRLRAGSRVDAREGCIRCAGGALPLAGLPVWAARIPDVHTLQRTTDLAAEVLQPAASRSALLGSLFTGRLRSAESAVEDGDLEGAAEELGGLGPGLTPSGDDALAGILVAARVRWTSTAEARLTDIAAGVKTHDISRAFLHWAARGQSIRPLHQCLIALATGDRRAAEVAVRALAAYGHTSGADLSLGLRLGLVVLPAQGRPASPRRPGLEWAVPRHN